MVTTNPEENAVGKATTYRSANIAQNNLKNRRVFSDQTK